uniref:BolA-like protein n=1 Tax=Ditylenchus dipsaci TaxID=166011 RepID=A0A915DX05_9BILA
MASTTTSTSARTEGPVTIALRKKLADFFNPVHLEVECESPMHNVPKGKEIHFRALIVSDKFEGLRQLDRQRMVNKVLAEELKTQIHALRIEAKQPSEYVGDKQIEPQLVVVEAENEYPSSIPSGIKLFVNFLEVVLNKLPDWTLPATQMPKCREIILVSERPRDDGRAIANEIAEFLTFYAHQVVYLCSSHSLLISKQLLTMGCYSKSAPFQVDQLSASKHFSVVLFDDNDCQTNDKKKVAEFRVRFFQPEIMPVPKMRQFKAYFDKLKQQLRDGFVGKPLILKIFCTLVGGTSTIDRHGEHCWREAEVVQQFSCTPFVEPVNENVCCELAQMRFLSLICGDAGIRHECPEGTELEYSLLSGEGYEDNSRNSIL